MNTNFSFGAAETNDGVAQRARADENETNGFHHFFRRVAMRRFFHVDHDVGAVKRDDARPRPAQNQRQQMDGDMPEINVEQLRIVAIENCPQLLLFTARDLPRRVLKLLEPEPAQEMSWRFADNLNGRKWESRRLLTFLRDHDWTEPLQRRDLPVDVQHLRLEECRAVTRCDWSFRRHVGTMFWFRQKTTLKNLMPAPFSRVTWILNRASPRIVGRGYHAFLGGAVTSRRAGIEHLERIAAANRPGNDTGDLPAVNGWRRCFLLLNLLLMRWGGQILRRCRSGHCDNEQANHPKSFHRISLRSDNRTPRYFLPLANARPKLAPDGLS